MCDLDFITYIVEFLKESERCAGGDTLGNLIFFIVLFLFSL